MERQGCALPHIPTAVARILMRWTESAVKYDRCQMKDPESAVKYDRCPARDTKVQLNMTATQRE